ncbi:tRNA pseudouridine(55) synthase TruB [Desulfovibrio sp. OttesenSCG-928-G15]|nr:tRNA pseudouridine(55) synthase TruB [Desulfovibrio sp. OttesenSCG-928-G15]
MKGHTTIVDNRAQTQEEQANIPAQADGILVLNKPAGLTSAACIGKIKKRLGQKKIGHAGTLDPMATGVLLVLLGQATKISGHLMDMGEKTYSGIIRLGLVTDTWDAEGEVVQTCPVTKEHTEDLDSVFASFVGTYEQEVPAYSAAKHQGKPLYALARKGAAVPVKSKIVTISRGEAEMVGLERVRFRVTCSSGTYIRSLAHSLGSRLGCGAMLEELNREYSHPFGIDKACPLDELLANPEAFSSRVASIAEALPGWPKVRLKSAQAAEVRNGTRLPYNPQELSMLPFMPGVKALFLDENGKCLALAETVRDSAGRELWALIRGLWN